MTFRATTAAIVVLGLSWHAMLAVHELGHVIHARITGGGGLTLHVDLHPLRFSSTFVDPNPHPLLVVIGGPLWGCLLPCVLHFAVTLVSSRPRKCPPSTVKLCRTDLTRFFAGFCLLVNGAYIGLGWIDRVGDAGDLIRHGAPIWSLALAGTIATAAGLWLWHHMGPRLGLAKLQSLPTRQLAVIIVAWLALLTLEAALGTWT